MAVCLVFEGSVIPHQCYRSICVPQSILDASQDSIPARAVMVDVTSPDPDVQVASLLPAQADDGCDISRPQGASCFIATVVSRPSG